MNQSLSRSSLYYEEDPHPCIAANNSPPSCSTFIKCTEKSVEPEPVEIREDTSIAIDLPPISWQGYNSIPKILSATNTGQTILINGQWANGRPFIKGGPLNGSYIFSQIHFHCPSEHEVEGERFPLEMHAVHYKACYLTQERAMQEKDGIVVLVYLFQLSDSGATVLSYITQLYCKICEVNDRAEMTQISLDQILKSFSSNYYIYWGSVVTEKRSYSLQWIVNCNVFCVSQNEVKDFEKLMSSCEKVRTNTHMKPVNDTIYRVGEEEYRPSSVPSLGYCGANFLRNSPSQAYQSSQNVCMHHQGIRKTVQGQTSCPRTAISGQSCYSTGVPYASCLDNAISQTSYTQKVGSHTSCVKSAFSRTTCYTDAASYINPTAPSTPCQSPPPAPCQAPPTPCQAPAMPNQAPSTPNQAPSTTDYIICVKCMRTKARNAICVCEAAKAESCPSVCLDTETDAIQEIPTLTKSCRRKVFKSYLPVRIPKQVTDECTPKPNCATPLIVVTQSKTMQKNDRKGKENKRKDKKKKDEKEEITLCETVCETVCDTVVCDTVCEEIVECPPKKLNKCPQPKPCSQTDSVELHKKKKDKKCKGSNDEDSSDCGKNERKKKKKKECKCECESSTSETSVKSDKKKKKKHKKRDESSSDSSTLCSEVETKKNKKPDSCKSSCSETENKSNKKSDSKPQSSKSSVSECSSKSEKQREKERKEKDKREKKQKAKEKKEREKEEKARLKREKKEKKKKRKEECDEETQSCLSFIPCDGGNKKYVIVEGGNCEAECQTVCIPEVQPVCETSCEPEPEPRNECSVLRDAATNTESGPLIKKKKNTTIVKFSEDSKQRSNECDDVRTIYKNKRDCTPEPERDCTINYLMAPKSQSNQNTPFAMTPSQDPLNPDCLQQNPPDYIVNTLGVPDVKLPENFNKDICLQTEHRIRTEKNNKFSGFVSQEYNVAILLNRNVLQEFKGTIYPNRLEPGNYEQLNLYPKYPDPDNIAVHLEDCFVKMNKDDELYIRTKFQIKSKDCVTPSFCKKSDRFSTDSFATYSIRAEKKKTNESCPDSFVSEEVKAVTTFGADSLVSSRSFVISSDVRSVELGKDKNNISVNSSNKSVKNLFFKRKKTVYFTYEKIEKDQSSGKKIFVGNFRTKDEMKALLKDRQISEKIRPLYTAKEFLTDKEDRNIYLLPSKQSYTEELIRFENSKDFEMSDNTPAASMPSSRTNNKEEFVTLLKYKPKIVAGRNAKTESQSVVADSKSNKVVTDETKLNSGSKAENEEPQVAFIIIPVEVKSLAKLEVILVEHSNSVKMSKNKDEYKTCSKCYFTFYFFISQSYYNDNGLLKNLKVFCGSFLKTPA